MGEACSRCGGVQIKFQGKIYCLNEDDLSDVLSPGTGAPQKQMPTESASPQSRAGKENLATGGVSQGPAYERDHLRKTLEQKLERISRQLEETEGVDEQTKLLELISKYVEILNKLR